MRKHARIGALQSSKLDCSTDSLLHSAGVQTGCAQCSKQRALCRDVSKSKHGPARALLSQDVCLLAVALAALAIPMARLRSSGPLLRH